MTSTALEVVQGHQLTLDGLAAAANREHELCLTSFSSTLEHAASAGVFLMRAKEELGHGQWLPWLEGHFLGSEDTAQNYMRVARLPETERSRYLSVDAALKAARKRLDVHYSSDTPEWETPDQLFDALNDEFNFTLDVCATSENAKCRRYFTEESDGLEQDWSQDACWMNPPYGRQIGRWVEKAYNSATSDAPVVCLVPARTDTDWWWQWCRFGEIRFLKGRLRFNDAETGAPFPSAVVVFGRKSSVKWWER